MNQELENAKLNLLKLKNVQAVGLGLNKTLEVSVSKKLPDGAADDGRLPGAARERKRRGCLRRRTAQPAPGSVLRRHRSRETPDGRKAVRNRPAGQRGDPRDGSEA